MNIFKVIRKTVVSSICSYFEVENIGKENPASNKYIYDVHVPAAVTKDMVFILLEILTTVLTPKMCSEKWMWKQTIFLL